MKLELEEFDTKPSLLFILLISFFGGEEGSEPYRVKYRLYNLLSAYPVLCTLNCASPYIVI